MNVKSLVDPIKIGNVEVRNRSILAPMTGVSDLPFRELAWEYGAGLVVSEMVASEAFLTGQTEYQLKSEMGDLPTRMVQLVGRDAAWMAKAAKVVEANGADIIDINMGCPARKVTNGYSGSALMRDLDHALTLIDAVVQAVEVPVTLKMRLGWDTDSINAPELAVRAEAAGIQMITVHGRTRNQFYKGEADWQAIAAVKDAINIPLVVNGDIIDQVSADAALMQSGADAIMIGRGCYGAPWIAGKLAGENAPGRNLSELNDHVRLHYERMLSFYGNHVGVRRARKHLGWYFARLPQSETIENSRQEAMRADDPAAVMAAWARAAEFAQDGYEQKAAA